MVRIHFVVNARIPHTRAYGIHVAKMSEALIEAGAEVTLIVPKTRASQRDIQEVNELRVPVRTVVLPGLDWSDKGKLAFLIASAVFMFNTVRYLRRARKRGAVDVVYTVDMDTFSYAVLPFSGVPCVAEMHGAKRPTVANTFFFKRACGIVATNREIADELTRTFRIPTRAVIVEPNGVDLHAFEAAPDKRSARTQLGLPSHAPIALYAGRFYEWKGLEILPRAAEQTPDIQWYVIGGTEESFMRYARVATLPENLHVAGDKPVRDIPLWQAAADVLLILGTKTHEQSYRFTAPMKVYEYMAARRPVVAAATPALTSIIPDTDALFYIPDDASDLARLVVSASAIDATPMLERSFRSASSHTWLKRAERVLSFISTL